MDIHTDQGRVSDICRLASEPQRSARSVAADSRAKYGEVAVALSQAPAAPDAFQDLPGSRALEVSCGDPFESEARPRMSEGHTLAVDLHPLVVHQPPGPRM